MFIIIQVVIRIVFFIKNERVERMNHNMDNHDPSFYESMVYMHDLQYDLVCNTQVHTSSGADVFEYSIHYKDEKILFPF